MPARRSVLTRVGYLVVVGSIGLAFGLALRWFGSGATPGANELVTGAAPSLTSPGVSGTTAGAPSGFAASAGPSGDATAATPVVLVGAGDIADCGSDGDQATAGLLDTIEGTVFTLGDNVYERGTAAEFERCYGPTWGRHRLRTMPVTGNHDYGTPGAAGYFDYFGAVAGDPATGWYAYDRGAWRVYVLNSNCAAIGGCAAGSDQERWLRTDLAANPRPCVLAMWHHPRFSSGRHGNDVTTADLWRALSAAGAELVLNGHDHDYERFAPQTPAGNEDHDEGLVEIIVGTGGRSHYAFETVRANSLVRDDTTYGVLRLVLSDGAWSFDFVPVAGGGFSDSGGGTCH